MPRAPKKCGHRGCEHRGTNRYCPTHTAEHQRRANTTQRGYGWQHQQHRAAAIANLQPGQPCARCHQPLLPGQPLADDHNNDRTGYLGLSHAHCNNQAGAMTPRRGTPTPHQHP